jgi:hypothetical protein
MSYLQRKMFANGGGAEANPYYYVSPDRKLVPLDSNQLYDVLSTAGIGELTALIQNPDVEYSPATQELFRRVVGERRARGSSTTPNNLEFGKALPDYLDFYSGLENIGGIAKDTILEGAERGVGLFRGLMADQGDPQDLFVSERFPFNRQGQPVVDPFQGRPDPTNVPELIGRAAEGLEAKAKTVPPLFDRSGSLRRGFSNPELAAILNRAQSGEIQDFEEEIEELVKPDVVDTAVVEEVTEQVPRELPRGIVEIRNISPEDYEGSNIALLKQEMEIMGRDEEGNPLPETRLLRDPEIQDLLDEIKPIELKVDVDKTEADSLLDVEEKFDGLPDSEVQELLEPIKPILSIPEAAAEAEKAQEEQDDDQPPPARDVITRKLEEPGFFGSDRFLDFIRNVGGELTRTGQFGPGLSLGASKAAEERAARELMAEQEERDFASKLRLARAEAALEGTGFMDPTDANKITDQENALADNIQSFEKSRNTLSNLNKVIGILDEGGATGLRGFFGEATDMIEAAISKDNDGKSFDELKPRTRANSLLKVLRQANVREILGESGKTISNLDRQIVEEVFGDIRLTTPVAVSIKKLEDSRRNILNGMMSTQNKIINSASFFDNIGYTSRSLKINQPILDLIKAFTFANAESYIAPDTSDAGIIDTTL